MLRTVASQLARSGSSAAVAVFPRRAFASGLKGLQDLTLEQTRAVPEYYIIDTTLREGEQFASAEFTSHDRVYLAKQLDLLGVDYIELVNPLASKQAAADCSAISAMPRRAKVVCHTRCHMDDVRAAVHTGVDGVNMYMATSQALRQHSHGLTMQEIAASAAEVITYVKDHGLEVRFSCEDTFRSDPTEVLELYKTIAELGVNRVGLADTVGIATPLQVYRTVQMVREAIPDEVGIEFHAHDDTGCCVANAFVALQAGATHVNTCLLGIGERNGITPLGALLARMYTLDREGTTSRYDLSLIKHMEKYVANVADVTIPFNNCVTGSAAFTHKAGVHSKAVLNDPSAYEVITPEDFGVIRDVKIAHRLTGWNALRQRANLLDLTISDDQIKVVTRLVKTLADDGAVTMEELDTILMQISRETAPTAGTGSTTLRQAASTATSAEVADALQSAAEAMAQLELKVAQDAVSAVTNLRTHDARPTIAVIVEGHLFDKAVLNRMFDIIVDSPCTFVVKQLNVGERDELKSSAVLQIWADEQAHLVEVRQSLDTLIAANADIAEVTLSDAAPTSNEGHMEARIDAE